MRATQATQTSVDGRGSSAPPTRADGVGAFAQCGSDQSRSQAPPGTGMTIGLPAASVTRPWKSDVP